MPPGPLGEKQKRPVPRGDADGQEPVQAGFVALVGWSARKSNDALGTVGCLREVYWHRLISQGTLLAAATTLPKNYLCQDGRAVGSPGGIMEGLW